MLALLSGSDGIRNQACAIIERLGHLEGRERVHSSAQLVVLSQLRGATTLVLREVQAMPMTVIAAVRAAAQGDARGELQWLRKARLAVLRRPLAQRFGAISPHRLAQLHAAEVPAPDRWLDRLPTAEGLAQIFAPSSDQAAGSMIRTSPAVQPARPAPGARFTLVPALGAA